MYTKLRLTLLLSLLPLCTLYAQNPRATTPDEIVRQLTHSDYRIMLAGVEDYVVFRPEDQRTPAMKAALVQALKNENERIRLIELRRDELRPIYGDHGSVEMAWFLVEEVYALKDPSTIPLLLSWLRYGGYDKMMDFGRQAFEPVLKFLETPQSGIDQYALAGGIRCLRMMVDYWDLSTFSASERERMKQVAARYIVRYDPNPEKNTWLLIKGSISLAASLREEALLQMAHALVNDDAEMAKRGSTAPEWVRGIAAKALAGTLEERQYVPYEERKRH